MKTKKKPWGIVVNGRIWLREQIDKLTWLPDGTLGFTDKKMNAEWKKDCRADALADEKGR